MQPQYSVFIGVDPGASAKGDAAIAVIDGLINPRPVFHDMPIYKKGKAQRVNVQAVAEMLIDYQNRPDVLMIVEDVHAMPGQGVSSTCNFCNAVGAIHGVAAGMRLAITEVSPTKWKKMFSLTNKDKDESRRVACRLYPKTAGELHLKKHVGRADALLMAVYGMRTDRGLGAVA